MQKNQGRKSYPWFLLSIIWGFSSIFILNLFLKNYVDCKKMKWNVMFLGSMLVLLAPLLKNYIRFFINLSSHLWCSIYCENHPNIACNVESKSCIKILLGERNIFTNNAPIRRVTCKKLHKVFHQSIFAPSVLDILWKPDKHCSQCLSYH